MKTPSPLKLGAWFDPLQLALKLSAVATVLALISGLSAQISVSLLAFRAFIAFLGFGLFGYGLGLIFQYFQFDQIIEGQSQITEIELEENAAPSTPTPKQTPLPSQASPGTAIIPRPEQSLTPHNQ